MYEFIFRTTLLEVLTLFFFSWLFEKQYIQEKISMKQIFLTQIKLGGGGQNEIAWQLIMYISHPQIFQYLSGGM
jgi:hypothetical protein